jgi:hypothetical protein
MKFTIKILFLLFYLALVGSSCESETETKERLARAEKERIEIEEKRKSEEVQIAYQLEQERIEREKKEAEERREMEALLEKERRELVIYDRYINNSLRTGTTPYAYCFGENRSCSDNGCSEIKVKTPYNSDVLVTIKKDGEVVRHAYISAGSSYTFQMPNGSYQPFFYYGKGWNPNKVMKEVDCGMLKGGFIDQEDFGKDSPQYLSNDILTYELILQSNGNFSTRPSNSEEAF